MKEPNNGNREEEEDLIQLAEMINAGGDSGEIDEIASRKKHLTCNEELFNKELRAIADDAED
ncbi:hypothetical protein [Bacillus sp. MUM 13]|uniref:hypothetical protein n=1 Tax=Bacillus sp. MUM 13 TaxID=1678001 RepID=UPI0008F5BA7B|nr:hypothetical protein [Bacillus sp. MUM 13]OIK10506.1 hypothetical protein BIV59_14230 [Bacillus sp. MUM 13]